jgi:hypothetical protein
MLTKGIEYTRTTWFYYTGAVALLLHVSNE